MNTILVVGKDWPSIPKEMRTGGAKPPTALNTRFIAVSNTDDWTNRICGLALHGIMLLEGVELTEKQRLTVLRRIRI